MKKKTRKKKIRFNIYAILFVCLCFLFGKTLLNQIEQKKVLNSKIETLQTSREQLNSEIESIKKDIQDKDTEDFVVKIAREKLKMVKKNEIIVKYKN